MTLRKAVKEAKKELDSEETCIIRKGNKEIWCFSRPMADTLARLTSGSWKKLDKVYIVTAS